MSLISPAIVISNTRRRNFNILDGANGVSKKVVLQSSKMEDDVYHSMPRLITPA
jgi:hypothetical protein